MDLSGLFADNSQTQKEIIQQLSELLLKKQLKTTTLIAFAESAKDPVKAGCIEALEFASKKDPEIITAAAFDFVTEQLKAKAPRIKWESAKVVGNTAHLFPKKLDAAIRYLLDNSEHSGTVVRWSAAYALGEIVKTGKHKMLETAIDAIMKREEKNSIRKIYEAALKKIHEN
ncbi:MAG: hypothetical protein ACXVPQ_03230 [Bacteroidia bacterium]